MALTREYFTAYTFGPAHGRTGSRGSGNWKFKSEGPLTTRVIMDWKKFLEDKSEENLVYTITFIMEMEIA